jgi:hypothetical protein
MLLLSLNFSVFEKTCFRRDSRYSEKDAAVVVRQMLKVAAECHLHGLVHRDMKPEVGNFFILKVVSLVLLFLVIFTEKNTY